MVKNQVYEQGKKDVLRFISQTLKEYLHIQLNFSSQEELTKHLLSILMERPCLLKFHKIDCKKSELIFLQQEINEFLRLFENGLVTQRKFRLKKFRFDIILKPETVFESKTSILNQFTEIFQDNVPETINSLLEEIQRLKYKLHSNSKLLPLIKEDTGNFHSSNPESIEPKHHFTSVADMVYHKLLKKQELITHELEWEKYEISFLNSKLTKKNQKLLRKKRIIEEREADLRKQKILFLQEKTEFTKSLSDSCNKNKSLQISLFQSDPIHNY